MKPLKNSILIWDQVGDLMKAVDAVRSDPNSQFDEYKRGVANGLILALSIMQDLEPEYIEPYETQSPALLVLADVLAERGRVE